MYLEIVSQHYIKGKRKNRGKRRGGNQEKEEMFTRIHHIYMGRRRYTVGLAVDLMYFLLKHHYYNWFWSEKSLKRKEKNQVELHEKDMS